MSENNPANREHGAEEASREDGHGHEHCNGHIHHENGVHAAPVNGEYTLTIRSHSGLSGDILLSGLAVINLEREKILPESAAGKEWLETIVTAIMPELANSVALRRISCNGIMGWQSSVELAPAHEHRNLADIKNIILASKLSGKAAEKAMACFELLARAEGDNHGLPPQDVHFHEIGAMDSILDICSVCELYERLGDCDIVCAPLPMSDGAIACAHGILPSPAPATLSLLRGIPVRPFSGNPECGELVTPTAIALLRTLNAKFGKWPAFRVDYTALVYGQRYFEGAPNGTIFAFGKKYDMGDSMDFFH